MNDSEHASGPQFRADRPDEQETVRTTIVGGRPPGSGQRLGPIPRGVEVLVKKASLDDEFKQALLSERAEAAKRIGLTLDPAEILMLAAVPAEQLETIIAQTTVPREHRRAFLGTAAAAMLAAVGMISSGCDLEGRRVTKGISPDVPARKKDVRPERNDMGSSGGARPQEPPPKRMADPEPPSAENNSTNDSGIAPAETDGKKTNKTTADSDRITRGIRPDHPKSPPKTGGPDVKPQ